METDHESVAIRQQQMFVLVKGAHKVITLIVLTQLHH